MEIADVLKDIVGAHIRELRKKAGYRTLEAFAEALDVHPNSVGELERGANWISPEMLHKMIKLFNLPPAAFFPGGERLAKGAPLQALDGIREALIDQERRIRELEGGAHGEPVIFKAAEPHPLPDLSRIPRRILDRLASANDDEISEIEDLIFGADEGDEEGEPESQPAQSKRQHRKKR